VPKLFKQDLQLGNWVDNQRTIFKNGKMGPERKSMLDEIGFKGDAKDKTNKNMKFPVQEAE
jgi:hypothetical protein